MTLTETDRAELLALARRAIAQRVADQPVELPRPAGRLAEPTGAFVTLHEDRELCGCLGYTERDRPLAEVVTRCAAAAAVEDPRFSPLVPGQLPRVVIEISVLGPFEALARPLDFEIGRHGLAVERGAQSGLLLPQVAVERGWDAETLLGQVCVKAGLRRHAWRRGARLFRFEAVVFAEASACGGGAGRGLESPESPGE